MFDPAEDYVWDFWLLEEETADGARTHLFFLCAPRTLGDPELRHRHARIGHAVSTDLTTWERLPDVIARGEDGRFDDQSIWTGCTVRGDDGVWRLFYSALDGRDLERQQRIGQATSPDGITWTRSTDAQWPLEADPRWYAVHDSAGRAGQPQTPETHWRDPFVVRDGDGLWHMYVTAKTPTPSRGNGCVGHATSTDLDHWEVQPPLGGTDGRFDQLEVIQVVDLGEGRGTADAPRWVMVFSCLSGEMPGSDPTDHPGDGGTWVVPVPGPGLPVDAGPAVRLTDESLYVAKLVRRPTPARADDGPGEWCLLAFRLWDADGVFVGGIIDPLPVSDRLNGFSADPGEPLSAPIV